MTVTFHALYSMCLENEWSSFDSVPDNDMH